MKRERKPNQLQIKWCGINNNKKRERMSRKVTGVIKK